MPPRPRRSRSTPAASRSPPTGSPERGRGNRRRDGGRPRARRAGANGARLGSVSLAGASAALRYIDAGQGACRRRDGDGGEGAARCGCRSRRAHAARRYRLPCSGRGGAAHRGTAGRDAPPRRLRGSAWPTPASGRSRPARSAAARRSCCCPVRRAPITRSTRSSSSRRQGRAGRGRRALGDSRRRARIRRPRCTVSSTATSRADRYRATPGAGLGDCGVAQTYAWDGRRLRLVEQSAMGECRGNPNYLRTWIATVAAIDARDATRLREAPRRRSARRRRGRLHLLVRMHLLRRLCRCA
ncbi:DUF1176 domain-containing protein [Sphingomonas sp. MMS24-JH45]